MILWLLGMSLVLYIHEYVKILLLLVVEIENYSKRRIDRTHLITVGLVLVTVIDIH